jgi:hypothetical protein
VLNPEKALPLFKRKSDPYAINAATGVKMSPPSTKLGKLSPSVTPEADSIYFMMFANQPGGAGSGAKMTIVIDELKIEDVAVE